MYQLSVWIHIVAAAIWVGGLVYTAAVVVPFAVKQGGEDRQRILRGLARRFRTIGWGSIIILILTGLGNLALRYSPFDLGRLFNGDAFNPQVVGRPMAEWLPWKLVTVAIMVALMVFHDITSVRAAKMHTGDPGAAPGNRAGSIAAAVATLLAVVVVYISVRMVRG